MVSPDEFETKITNIEYKDGYLVFTFDKKLPQEWIHTIIHGSYSCSFMHGYEHERLDKVSDTTLRMHLRGREDDSTIKSLVGYVKSWVETVNKDYMASIKRKIADEYRKKENDRKAEIEKIEKENKMSSKISAMLSDLL